MHEEELFAGRRRGRDEFLFLQRCQVWRQILPAVEAEIMGDLFERRVTDEVFAATRLQVDEHTQLWRTHMAHELAENDRQRHKAPFAVEYQFFRLRKMLLAEP